MCQSSVSKPYCLVCQVILCINIVCFSNPFLSPSSPFFSLNWFLQTSPGGGLGMLSECMRSTQGNLQQFLFLIFFLSFPSFVFLNHLTLKRPFWIPPSFFLIITGSFLYLPNALISKWFVLRMVFSYGLANCLSSLTLHSSFTLGPMAQDGTYSKVLVKPFFSFSNS